MRVLKLLSALPALIVLVPQLGFSQHTSTAIGFGIGGTKAEEFSGATLSVSVEGAASFVYGAVAVDGSISATEEGDRFVRDEFSNGDSRCRDTVTGRFAKDSKCLEDDYAVLPHAGIRIRLDEGAILVGAGYRLGDHSTAFGIMAYRFSVGGKSDWSVELAAGDDFFRGLFSIVIPLGKRIP